MEDSAESSMAAEHNHLRHRNSGGVDNTEVEDSPSISKEKKGFWNSRVAPNNLFPKFTWPVIWITRAVYICLAWGLLYILVPRDMGLTGSLFILLSTFLFAYMSGRLIRYATLPPLLGMLLAGILVRNVGFFRLNHSYKSVVPLLRNVAMVIILIKAGLGLDGKVLKKMSGTVLLLAFVPCFSEALAAAVVCHFILGHSWVWSLLLGFILGAVSPAVVVPSLLVLKEHGYGEDKGISTLVIAASSIDDIAAISAFGIVLSILFSEGNLLQQILQGPLEVIYGLTFGILWGVLVMYIPHKDDLWRTGGRVVMTVGGGLFAVLGSMKVGYSGAGPLGCITAAFVACTGWKAQGWPASNNSVQVAVSVLWIIFQPVLFSLIGSEIDFTRLDSNTLGCGLAVLFSALSVRILMCFLVTLKADLNWKERLFICIAWLPKATVQAAIGPVALDIVRSHVGYEEEQTIAVQILTIAVLSILVTAPIGAVGIALGGPLLLNKVDVPETQVQDDEDAMDENSEFIPAIPPSENAPPAAAEFNREAGIV